MKFKQFILMVFVLLTIGCVSSQQQIQNSQLSSLHTARLDQAIKLRNIAANEVWPGYGDFIPSVVYFTETSQFLINPSGQPPSEYILTKIKGPNWASRVFQANHWTGPTGQQLTTEEIKKEYIANGFSSRDTNGHFLFSVFFLDSLEQFHLKGTDWKLDDWYAVFWHEVFHNFQDQLYDQKLIPDDVRNFKHVAKNSKSESFLERIRREQKILSQVLKTSNAKLKRRLLCKDFRSKREVRYKEMPYISVQAELFNEISEGTARYVEENLSTKVGKILADNTVRDQFKYDGFYFFEKYRNNSINIFSESILKISPDNLYFYNSGFALALVLDQVQPNWKKNAFKNSGFLYGELMDWCK